VVGARLDVQSCRRERWLARLGQRRERVAVPSLPQRPQWRILSASRHHASINESRAPDKLLGACSVGRAPDCPCQRAHEVKGTRGSGAPKTRAPNGHGSPGHYFLLGRSDWPLVQCRFHGNVWFGGPVFDREPNCECLPFSRSLPTFLAEICRTQVVKFVIILLQRMICLDPCGHLNPALMMALPPHRRRAERNFPGKEVLLSGISLLTFLSLGEPWVMDVCRAEASCCDFLL